MAHRPHSPPSPRLSGVPRRLLRPPPPPPSPSPPSPPSSPSLPDWFSLVSRKGLPGPTKQGVLHLQPLELHWGATVSLEASRLVGFLLLPPTFNHLFTGPRDPEKSVAWRKHTKPTWTFWGLVQISRRGEGEGEVASLAGGDATTAAEVFFKPEFLS